MIATWFGGPYDGRTDELPYGTESVSVAHPIIPHSFVEVRCRLYWTNKGWVILWHEP